MFKIISGSARVFARDDIDTDLIIPAKYLTTTDALELGSHALETLDSSKLIESNCPIVVAGRNFGCGSSREHAVWALAGAGVQAVIAESFARIFFRNSINFGLPIFAISGAAEKFATDDKVEINFEKNIVKNISKNTEYKFEALPEFLQEIVSAGGLLNQI